MYCLPQNSRELWKRARQIEALFMDVDGVLTGGEIVYDTRQEEIKFFNALDGFGIKLAQLAGLQVGLISARESEAIRHRARELKIAHVHLGVKDKLAKFIEVKETLALPEASFCFIGDDLPDLPVLQRVGLPVVVANAAPALLEKIPFRTRRCGGAGAVREVVEFILYVQNRLQKWVAKFEQGGVT